MGTLILIGAAASLSLGAVGWRKTHPHSSATGNACQRSLDGTWFAAAGTVEVGGTGQWRLRTRRGTLTGAWARAGDELHLSDRAIRGPGVTCSAGQLGTYRLEWSSDACAVKLEATADPCAGRRRVLDHARLSRFFTP